MPSIKKLLAVAAIAGLLQATVVVQAQQLSGDEIKS
jgi:hypothetical protein